MNYQLYEPSEDLKPFVKCYWTLESTKEDNSQRQTIVPDGCMEMIFHYGDLYKQYTVKGETIIQPRCFVMGQLTQPLEIEATGDTGIFAVRFHPEGFLPFTAFPIKKMENKAVPLQTIFNKNGNEIAREILNLPSSVNERINSIEKFLLNNLMRSETIDRVVKSTVDLILAANGQMSVDDISKKSGISRRQIERKFLTATGLSPKKISKTIRLQSALKIILSGDFKNFTELALESEYYDQSHFIKDFRYFTGLSPKEFYGENLIMSSLFYGTD